MRILWLTADRSKRFSSHIFIPFTMEVYKKCDVDFVIRDTENQDFQKYSLQLKEGSKILPPVLSPNEVNSKYDVIFSDTWWFYKNEDWRNIKCFKIMFLEDLHNRYVKADVRKALNFNFDCFATRYYDPAKKFQPDIFKKRVLWIPHSIDPDMFNDLKLKRDINVLSIGSMIDPVYKKRSKVNDILKNTENFRHIKKPAVFQKERFKKKKIEFPCGTKYVEILNRSKATISCASTLEYTVIKMYEIPACGSVLFSSFNNEMRTLGFRPEENFISYDNNCSDVVQKYRKFILDDDKRREIAKNGHDFVMNNHTTKIRAENFIRDLENI